jgi:tRNA(Ile)-lysidine synthase
MLVGVSGGLDSMVLAHALRELARMKGWRLTLAHFNHQLRGRSSDADQRLVERAAKAWKLPLMTGSGDVRGAAEKLGVSLEVAARTLRHRFFAQTARRRGISTLALAHHADDQVELFFLRLFRGNGGEALLGMKRSNPSPVDRRLTIVRPLLDVPKAALREYAAEHRVPFREDATNASLEIPRNRVRNELLPLLRKHYRAGVDQAVLRVMRIAQAENDLVRRMAEDWLRSKKKRRFSTLPVAVQRFVIQQQFLERGWPVDFDKVEFLRTRPQTPVAIEVRWAESASVQGPNERTPARPRRVRLDRNGLVHQVEDSAPRKRQPASHQLSIVRAAGVARFGRLTVRWQVLEGNDLRRKVKFGPGVEFLDAERLGNSLVLRLWQPGDRFQPLGMGKECKVQDFLTNAKVPRSERHSLVFGATRKGEVFWIEGLRISERFKLTRTTRRCLRWEWERR